MEVLTLYAGQGALTAIRCGGEVVIIDAHMPTTEHVTLEQIETTLAGFVKGRRVRGLIITGLDKDHAHPEGVESILTKQEPDWVMYPKCYKNTDCATSVFDSIERHRRRRQGTVRPLNRVSVRLDHLESRLLSGLSSQFSFELFSPHIEDMDSSNNSSIVVKIASTGREAFSYLVTGDTETERWERISELFGPNIRSDVLAAPHHGSTTGVHPKALLHIAPDTVLISAGVDSQFDHPHSAALHVYSRVARKVFSTNGVREGTCLFTFRKNGELETRAVRHG